MAHFGVGSKGILIQRLRRSVGLSDVTGSQGEPMVQRYDAALATEVGDTVDEALYAVKVEEPFPGLFERALMVITFIERHGYFTNITPENPKTEPGRAGITMGIVGFQACSGSLGRLLRDLVPADIGALQVFLIERGITDPRDQEGFLAYRNEKKDPRTKAMDVFLTANKKAVKSQWMTFLRRLLAENGAQQERHARTAYFDSASTPELQELGMRAEDAARLNGLTSELGKLLAFSICIQGGNLKDQEVDSSLSDRERRIEIAIRRSKAAGKKSGFDQRHIQLAKGFGYVNRTFFDLSAWGFEPDPPPPVASRILSLAFSGSPSMAALSKFEAAAVAKGGVQEGIIESAKIKALLQDAGTPNGAAGIPDFSKAWHPSRTKFLRLFAQLDELPLDILVLGGEVVGTALKGDTQLLVMNDIISWKNSDFLDLPFVPRMRNGLVVLFASAALPRLGRALQQAIGAIDHSHPLILGWTGPIKAFPGKDEASCADAFFTEIQSKPKKLTELIATEPETVIQAWGKACFDAFAHDFPGLWHQKMRRDPLSACAALAPNGEHWIALPAPENDVFMKKQ